MRAAETIPGALGTREPILQREIAMLPACAKTIGDGIY